MILSETPPEFVRQWTCPTSHVSPIQVSDENVSKHGLSKICQCRVQTCFDLLPNSSHNLGKVTVFHFTNAIFYCTLGTAVFLCKAFYFYSIFTHFLPHLKLRHGSRISFHAAGRPFLHSPLVSGTMNLGLQEGDCQISFLGQGFDPRSKLLPMTDEILSRQPAVSYVKLGCNALDKVAPFILADEVFQYAEMLVALGMSRVIISQLFSGLRSFEIPRGYRFQRQRPRDAVQSAYAVPH